MSAATETMTATITTADEIPADAPRIWMYDWAKRMASSKARRIIVHGGRGGGKDYAVADMALARMLVQPYYKVLCLRQFQNSIEDSLKATMVSRIHAHGWEPYFTVTHRQIVCPARKSSMVFYGLERNTASIRSMEGIKLAIVNEAQAITELGDRTLRPTVRGKGVQIVYIGNPMYLTDHFTRKLVYNKALGSTEWYCVNYWDNWAYWEQSGLEQERVDYLGDPYYQHIWEGQPISEVGAFFDASRIIKTSDAWVITPNDYVVRAWDTAATAGGGDFTVGVKMARRGNAYRILDIQRGQWSASEVIQRVLATAAQDGVRTEVVIEEGRGDAGLRDKHHWQNIMARYLLSFHKPTGPKAKRAEKFSASVGNCQVSTPADATWLPDLMSELAGFSASPIEMRGRHDDQVDACAMAFNQLSRRIDVGVASSGYTTSRPNFVGEMPKPAPAPAEEPSIYCSLSAYDDPMPGW